MSTAAGDKAQTEQTGRGGPEIPARTGGPELPSEGAEPEITTAVEDGGGIRRMGAKDSGRARKITEAVKETAGVLMNDEESEVPLTKPDASGNQAEEQREPEEQAEPGTRRRSGISSLIPAMHSVSEVLSMLIRATPDLCSPSGDVVQGVERSFLVRQGLCCSWHSAL